MTRIQSGEEDKIRRMVQLLNQYPASRFLIAGYTALAGTESGRTAISRGRARNVADFLIRQGIRAGRMELHWYGAAQPAAPNTTPANMARNRRVEFIVLSQE
jgi:outer membrane protein OmpA-like peptidoglycan-associated protein